jgi:hypothetical protein
MKFYLLAIPFVYTIRIIASTIITITTMQVTNATHYYDQQKQYLQRVPNNKSRRERKIQQKTTNNRPYRELGTTNKIKIEEATEEMSFIEKLRLLSSSSSTTTISAAPSPSPSPSASLSTNMPSDGPSLNPSVGPSTSSPTTRTTTANTTTDDNSKIDDQIRRIDITAATATATATDIELRSWLLYDWVSSG